MLAIYLHYVLYTMHTRAHAPRHRLQHGPDLKPSEANGSFSIDVHELWIRPLVGEQEVSSALNFYWLQWGLMALSTLQDRLSRSTEHQQLPGPAGAQHAENQFLEISAFQAFPYGDPHSHLATWEGQGRCDFLTVVCNPFEDREPPDLEPLLSSFGLFSLRPFLSLQPC